jgi:hypothetical protein
VITGIARAGINALIELAVGKQPRGRPVGLLCDNPLGRADAILNAGRACRSAMIAELCSTVASGQETPQSSAPAAGWPRLRRRLRTVRRWI